MKNKFTGRQTLRLSSARAVCLVALLAFLISIDAAAEDGLPDEQITRRPRVALVLSGGGARGAAHVGVLKVLEEYCVPIDFVTGTSMGAIVGGLYAAGLSPEEMEHMLASTDWNDMFSDRPARRHLSFRRKQEDLESLIKVEMGWNKKLTFPVSLIAGDKLMFHLRKLTLQTHAISEFDRLPVPFRAVATDIETGDMVVLKRGNLTEAMRASMAIPGAFAPQEIDGRLLVDGFLSQNLPVSVARDWGADIIIAVDVGSPLYARDELKSILKFAGQALTMMSRKNTREQMALLRVDDVLLQPELGSIRGLNFDRSAEAIAIGERTARQSMDAVRRLALTAPDYAAWRSGQRRSKTETVTIGRVRVENNGKVADKTIARRVGIKTGQPMKVEELRRGLDRVYDVGAFDQVDLKLVEENGQTNAVIHPLERATGRIHVRAGLKLFSDLDGDSDFNFLTSVTAAERNRLGAEWKNQVQFGRTTRLFSEWYQPLEYSRTFFAAPSVEFLQDKTEAVQADNSLVRAKYRTASAGMDLGAQLKNIGEIRVGPSWGRTDVYELHGLTLSDGREFTHAGAHARLTLDQFDNVDFPRSGYFGALEFYSSSEELGADVSYRRLAGSWLHAVSVGENTLLGGFNFGTKLGPDLPFYENFKLGGFLNLSGMPFEGLSDQYSGLGRLIYYRRVLRLNSRPVDAIYLGGSFEAGGVWNRAKDIDTKDVIFAGSAFVGADTMFGPLYLAYGQAEGGNNAFYFYLGRGF